MPPSIHANGVVPRTGLRRYHFTIANHDLLDNVQITPAFLKAASDWYMVVSLPRESGRFIRLKPLLAYKSGSEARKYVGEFLRVPPNVLQTKEFVVVAMKGEANFDLEVEINTDHLGLIEKAHHAVASAAPNGVPVLLDIDVFAADQESKRVLGSRVGMTLVLSPMREMAGFSGYSALDFGNTSTTLVCSETNQNDFQVIQADVVRPPAIDAPAPVFTALGISGITPGETPQQFTSYECRIGHKVVMDGREDGKDEWLVLGAKRLLSDRRQADIDNGADFIVLNNATHTIPSHDPAEVFISQMLCGFFYHRQSIPKPIVVTCPTTFSDSEVHRLRTIVARAFHRASGKSANSFQPEMVDALVPVVIDEASAAAFYFVHKDFISGPGRMPGFRYLYPRGMHMLLYDCGGGTTDLSLVKLEAADADHLKISVLGRAGHRTFGGDFITEQVFRILKMKLAALRGGIPAAPIPAKLKDFLEANKAAIDRAIPTTYDARQIQNQSAITRRQTALSLWQLAESLKLGLSIAGTQVVTPGEGEEQNLLNLIWRAISPSASTPEGQKFPEESMSDLKVHRREVDCLIDGEINRTVQYANDLIDTCLMPEDGSNGIAGGLSSLEVPEVHWVYIVGNASRYPRIREMLLDEQQGLRVRFLKDRLAYVASDDLKNSVAKGGIVAMKLRNMAMGMVVSWDRDLMKKLPFDIVHMTLGMLGDRVLFRTGELYSGLTSKTIDIKPDPATGNPIVREVVLSRRWPGDSAASPYVIFRFREPIEGPYLFEYDEEDAHGFIAYPKRAGGKEERVIGEPFDVPPYLAPQQSGNI